MLGIPSAAAAVSSKSGDAQYDKLWLSLKTYRLGLI